jgi:hypothetical protein
MPKTLIRWSHSFFLISSETTADGEDKPAPAAAAEKKPAQGGGGGDKPKPKPQAAPAKPPEKKKSNIIPTAGEAELVNGVGDVLAKGAAFGGARGAGGLECYVESCCSD